MPLEMGVWRIENGKPRKLPPMTVPTEAALESFLERDPSLLGERLLVIGRQVQTPHGKRIDLLAMDGDGNLVVLELKRDRTPRDVVAQILDYGWWVSRLDRDSVIDIANTHLGVPFEAAFEGVFGTPPPDELNTELRLTIVATELDSSSERIVNYLREFGVPVNAVFFTYLDDGDRQYLARSWLVESAEQAPSAPAQKKGKRADWNGKDWFVSFGDGLGRSWQDARTYGFVSAGGGSWYSRTLRNLPVGARVWVHIANTGYVGVGTTLGEAVRFAEAEVQVGGQRLRLADQHLTAAYRHGNPEQPVTDDEDVDEWVVPVRWDLTLDKADAFWQSGMFANQNSACKLRQEFTLERLAERFPGARHIE